MKDPNLQSIATQLIDQLGPSTPAGYIEGKRRLQDALGRILGEENDAPKMLNRLQEEGYLRFINRVGYDQAEQHWRIVARPL